ncbi:pyridoxal-phosphate dependent enzyme [Streptomyces sp. NPDC057555]|uniref:pyridoxal-phosphate dependent enzyme n=1 Tax=Streptomyces sp. NPDC057555 TaxID=3346166 RepID=UPI0036964733
MGINLTDFRRIPLGTWPTLLQEAPRLSELIGRRVLIKRDDVGELGLAGNKVRKLEFLLGEAVEAGADTVITLGALQSNHARLTAAATARLGLRCELVLYRSVPRNGAAYEESGNMLLDRLFGAVVHICATRTEAESFAEELAEKRRAAGRNALIVPVGGSNGLGSLGYVAAAAEIEAQLGERGIEQARIIAPLGSCGTAAGLVVGGSQLPWSFDFPCVRAAAEPSRADLSRGLPVLTNAGQRAQGNQSSGKRSASVWETRHTGSRKRALTGRFRHL